MIARYLLAVRWLASLVIVASLSVAPRADAQWGSYLHPERAQGERYLRQGLTRLVTASGRLDAATGDPARYVLLEQALLRFERARITLGDDPELAYYTAAALTAWERPARTGGTEHRTDEAIAAWQRLRATAPFMMPSRVAAELALLHMRRQEFDIARAEYERALEAAVPPAVRLMGRFYLPADSERALASLYGTTSLATLHANLGEVSMLAGDVTAAVESYESALRHADAPVARTLALWGLALASDRSGDHEAALRHAARALREDPIPSDDPRFRDLHERHGRFSVLHLGGVFFEPAYEIHAYEALGHEAAAAGVEDGARQRAAALRSWRLFLAEGGTSSRFVARAREHVERLEAAGVEASPAERRSRPTTPWSEDLL